MTHAHDSVPPSLPHSLAPSVLFLRSISQIICLHPSPCFRPCLQGNPGPEESQGLSEIEGTTDEDTETQEEMTYTESPGTQGQRWDRDPNLYTFHPLGRRCGQTGHAQGAGQKFIIHSFNTLLEGSTPVPGQDLCPKVQRAQALPSGSFQSGGGDRRVNRECQHRQVCSTMGGDVDHP